MSSPSVPSASLPTVPLHPQLRSAVSRVGRAANAVLTGSPNDELPLGAFRWDELRVAALRLLAMLDDADQGHAARLAAARLAVVDQALHLLATIDLHDLSRDDRAALAAAIAVVHTDLRAGGDDAVTRALLDATPPGPELAALVFDTDPLLLDPDAQVSYCQAAQRLESATHARLGAGLVAFSGPHPRISRHPIGGDDVELTDARAGELASALSWSSTRAHSAVDAARSLRNDLGSAAEAAASGVIQPAAITVIADGARLLTASIDGAIATARRTMACDADAEADIADRVWELTHAREELVQQYDSAVSAFAASHTVAETRRKVRDTIARLDPDGFAARRAQAAALQSSVEFRALPDAMAMITAVMPSEHATACFRAIDGAARTAPDGDAPIGLRRTQALYAFCAHRGVVDVAATRRGSDTAGPTGIGMVGDHPAAMGSPGIGEVPARAFAPSVVPAVSTGRASADAGTGGMPNPTDSGGVVSVDAADARLRAAADDVPAGTHDDLTGATAGAVWAGTGAAPPLVVPGASSLSAHVDLVMTLDAFLGLSDTPAECVGAGPIPAQAARELLADAALVTVRRVLVDGRTGRALDVGVRRYQLTESEREFIRLRDRTCRYPGCNQPAHRCQCDHAVPYEDGGPTRTDNLGALCVRHHQEKTHGGWAIEGSSVDGSCEFVSPLGRRYRHEAEPVLPWAWPADGEATDATSSHAGESGPAASESHTTGCSANVGEALHD